MTKHVEKRITIIVNKNRTMSRLAKLYKWSSLKISCDKMVLYVAAKVVKVCLFL